MAGAMSMAMNLRYFKDPSGSVSTRVRHRAAVLLEGEMAHDVSGSCAGADYWNRQYWNRFVAGGHCRNEDGCERDIRFTGRGLR